MNCKYRLRIIHRIRQFHITDRRSDLDGCIDSDEAGGFTGSALQPPAAAVEDHLANRQILPNARGIKTVPSFLRLRRFEEAGFCVPVGNSHRSRVT